MKQSTTTSQKVHKRIFNQLWMLAAVFVLGMGLNLVGEEATGSLHTLYVVLLVAHVLIAIGLIEGGIFVARKDKSKLAWWAFASLMVTLISGVGFAQSKVELLSFVMACGFIASGWLYVVLFAKPSN